MTACDTRASWPATTCETLLAFMYALTSLTSSGSVGLFASPRCVLEMAGLLDVLARLLPLPVRLIGFFASFASLLFRDPRPFRFARAACGAFAGAAASLSAPLSGSWIVRSLAPVGGSLSATGANIVGSSVGGVALVSAAGWSCSSCVRSGAASCFAGGGSPATAFAFGGGRATSSGAILAGVRWVF